MEMEVKSQLNLSNTFFFIYMVPYELNHKFWLPDQFMVKALRQSDLYASFYASYTDLTFNVR
jgi:hypothetical protein